MRSLLLFLALLATAFPARAEEPATLPTTEERLRSVAERLKSIEARRQLIEAELATLRSIISPPVDASGVNATETSVRSSTWTATPVENE